MSKYPLFNRNKIKFKSVKNRKSKFKITDISICPDAPLTESGIDFSAVKILAQQIKTARQKDRPVILCMGAHPIKNGCGELISSLVKNNFITLVASNGASAIHDYEFARFGVSCECVETYIKQGEFGLWKETGDAFGISMFTADWKDLTVGECLGDIMNVFKHPFKKYSVLHNCNINNVPFAVLPGIGQDIIFSSPTVDKDVGACINDFLVFCEQVKNLENGVYLSVGSSVMSPMVFEKALSMARNVEHQEGRKIENFNIAVNDLVDINWDWSKGEPPITDPAYYVRFMKTFHRAGGSLKYYSMDNVDFLRSLHHFLIHK